ncbi:hypothetical protein MB46_12405 [Arthrobacter alpinus]|nr:hypothetical protein MB46_12405 [Arthrobacter alpinus]
MFKAMVRTLFGHAYQALLEVGCFIRIHLNYEPSAAFERKPKDQAPTFFSHFHWTVAGPWFHGRHQEFPFS